MKKLFVVLLMAVVALGAKAQFEKGTHYVDAGITGLGIGSIHNQFNIGFSGSYGYYVAKGWMVGGLLGYQHCGSDALMARGLFRYTFPKFGMNLGAGLQYELYGGNRSYAQFCPQVGYTFYLNHWVSLEPSFYANIAFNEIKEGTSFGLKFSIGLYFNKKDVNHVIK